MSSEQTQPEREEGEYSDLNFTVHEYLRSTSAVRTTQDVLGNAYQIVKAAVSGDAEWKPVTFLPENHGLQSRNSYAFNGCIPDIVAEKECSKEIKEWGLQVTEDEVFNLDDLEEFIGSDFGHILLEGDVPVHAASTDPEAPKKRAKDASPAAEPEPKLKKRKLNIGSLYHVIPQPHMHPSPFSLSEAHIKGRPYKKVEPIFISPYTTLSLSDDTRLAWLIPVRGTFRWDHCTSGELLDNSHHLPFPPAPGTSDRVSWTEDSLRRFWQFLLDLRNIGSLGPLGVSFQATRNYKTSPDSKNPVSDSILTPSRATADSSTYSLNLSSNITMVDYIKVYHDGPKALYVRYALDIWQYQKSSEDGQSQKIRMLKGARLVLVDEASHGMLIS